MNEEETNKRIAALERENRILARKLARSEANRARLEDFKETNAAMYGNIIAEMRDTQVQLQASEQRAQQANQAKSAFLANMSHELRTPLTAVMGYAELLTESEPPLDDGQRSDVDTILTSAQHLLNLIDTVLDLSKIEADRMELAREPVELPALIEQLVNTARPLVEKNHNSFDVDIEWPLPPVVSDRTRLLQVLLNLAANAAKFTESGTVSLAVTVEGDEVVVMVKDTGIGMTTDELHRVYSPFEQANIETTRKYGGTGLGLAVASRLCEGMGCELEGSSVPGVGTEFRVRIPYEKGSPARPLP